MVSYDSKYSANGYINFTQITSSEIKIAGKLSNLTPNGTHAMHIHELGDLSNGCTSLAAHYNPFNHTHGSPGDCSRHVGDLGNIKAD